VDEELRRELEAAIAEYRASLAPRIAALEALRGDLASGKAPAARVADLHRELHSIAGSGRTFGLARVSEAARAAEAFVEAARAAASPPDGAAWERLKSLLQDLALAVP
jgi:chemotaxis protein histidine kinase CheA